MSDLKFNKLVPEVSRLISYVEEHQIEVKHEVNWDSDPTTIKLEIEIPWSDHCYGCGELVPRPDHHYGSLGNGWHQYQRRDAEGNWQKFILKHCEHCHIEVAWGLDHCPQCNRPVEAKEAR